ncbi:metallophosphoesterase family protein [Pedobacter agri]|uniref:metallophosphoesterase family protein n=1 Tax=Pedobacter agri TaxID=454586 RepID=UPI00277FCE9F|nr:metallophosphoesterase [Pedobacter agri]MDQ1142661.1 3',5'-cyclic AMP phosphodiesterase CpdA [Pedobacter agri]
MGNNVRYLVKLAANNPPFNTMAPSRRNFIKETVSSLLLAGISSSAAGIVEHALPDENLKVRLRFAIASDGHYGQPGTDYKTDHDNLIRWLNQTHEKTPLDFVIINGDLVHDQPGLLIEVKKDYYDRLKIPFYAIPGNHDHADTAHWMSVFGYEDNFSFEKSGVGFVLANTSNTEGNYLAPDNQFLKMELDKFKSLTTVFVILHIPPHIWVPQNPFVESEATISLLHSYSNVKAVFHGHDHSLDAVFYTGKLPHFFDSHIGGNWGTAYKGFRIVEVGLDEKIYTRQINASNHPILNEQQL